jgi:hypothetical protein
MGSRSVEVGGPLEPAAVWERYAVPTSWPDWLPQITAVDLSTPRLSAGAKGKLHAPMGVSIPFTVEAVDEQGRTFAWTIRIGLLKLRLENWVHEGADGGAVAGMRVNGPGPLVGAYVGQAQASLERLVGASPS